MNAYSRAREMLLVIGAVEGNLTMTLDRNDADFEQEELMAMKRNIKYLNAIAVALLAFSSSVTAQTAMPADQAEVYRLFARLVAQSQSKGAENHLRTTRTVQ